MRGWRRPPGLGPGCLKKSVAKNSNAIRLVCMVLKRMGSTPSPETETVDEMSAMIK